jgi:hypothetical protein
MSSIRNYPIPRPTSCNTCSWCRSANTSSGSAARERADVGRVGRNETSTDIIAQSVSIVGRNINCRSENGLFSNHNNKNT